MRFWIVLLLTRLVWSAASTPELFSKRRETAERLLAAGEVTKAIPRLQKLCASRHAPVDLHLTLLNALRSEGRRDEVEEHLRRMVGSSLKAAGRSHTPARAEEVADAAFWLASHLMQVKGSRQEIIQLLNSSLSFRPEHDDALHWLGYQLSLTPSGHEEAASVLRHVHPERLTTATPLDTLMLLGQAMERVSDLEAATRAFVAASSLRTASSPPSELNRFALASLQLGRILHARGLTQDALAVTRQGSRELPFSYPLRSFFAFLAMTTGERAEGLAEFQQLSGDLPHWPPSERAQVSRVVGSSFAWAQYHQPPRDSPRGVPHVTCGDAADGACTASAGGWGPREPAAEYESTRCTIPRRSALSREEFLEQYADRNLPVIIEDGVGGWPALQDWTRGALLKEHGHNTLLVRSSSEVAYDQEFGGGHGRVTDIRSYVEDVMDKDTKALGADPPYMFGTLKDVEDSWELPLYFNDSRFSSTREERAASALFFLGPPRSGVTLHSHTNAFNGLVYGRKRWFLLPPFETVGPTGGSMAAWLSEWYPRLRDNVWECTQEPGELLYVPTDWMHGVVNLENAVGIAVEVGHNTNLLDLG